MQQAITETYQKKVQLFQQQFESYQRQYNSLSVLRVLLFVVMAILVIYFANTREMSNVFVVLGVFLVAFVILVKYHNKISFQKTLYGNLKNLNEDELKRIDGELGSFDEGNKYKNDKHHYSNDLDVFGKNSLYQLLNRCATTSGNDMLADWLQSKGKKEVLLHRQEAVTELKPKLEWRQEFEALGKVFKDDESHIHTLLSWIKTPSGIMGKSWLKIALFTLPLLALGTIIPYFMGHLAYYWPLLALAINGIVMKKIDPVVSDTVEKTNASLKVLKASLLLIPSIENEGFKSSKLVELSARFSHDGVSAVKEISKLKTILNNLEVRANVIYLIVNVIFLLDLFWLLRAETWKKNMKGDVAGWFDTISEFEVLVSIAGYAYSNPGYSMPAISDTQYQFSSEELGHPLIKSDVRVYNDFSMNEKGLINIITGSNMAGKSTFLRTVGVNVVLALLGAPVCASKMTVSIMQVFTGMRTQDNLEESVSSFYAELQRIRQLLDHLAENDEPVMFMLDEILKGTNSADRHKGAEALIKQLSMCNATGFVSTHDLALGKMAEANQNFKNYSFNSSVVDEEIAFDYKITAGICQSFNASQLMKNMGIEI